MDGEGVLCGYWGVSVSLEQAGAHSGAARSEHHNFRNGENSRGMCDRLQFTKAAYKVETDVTSYPHRTVPKY